MMHVDAYQQVSALAPVATAGGARRSRRWRRSYTLVELLITVSIIGIMASMILFALYAAQQQARTQKTRALIARLDTIIRSRYESYRTRRVPVRFDNSEDNSPLLMAKMRLDVLRDLMRMEMPDRWSDVYDDPATPFERPSNRRIPRPSLSQAYLARYAAVKGDTNPPGPNSPIPLYQNAECLYMIVMEAVAQEADAREVFRPGDIADTDSDGFPEFVDAWGTPIRFLRWAPGFQSDLQTLATAKPASVNSPSSDVVTVTFDVKIMNGKAPVFGRGALNYVGGTLAVLDANGKIISDRMARITGYVNASNNAQFTCQAKMPGDPPFNGNYPTMSESVVVLAPDPFDSRGVYPIPKSLVYWTANSQSYSGTDITEIPTFAVYPLIYSAGPDKAFGISSDFGSTLVYSQQQLCPCVPDSGGTMIGTPGDFPNEPNYTSNAWTDNIHNHQLSVR